MQQQVFAVIKLKRTVINVVLCVVFIFILFVIMKSDINKLVCILFVHLSSISLENFKDRALIIQEILELIKLHTYKFGPVYLHKRKGNPQVCDNQRGISLSYQLLERHWQKFY